MVKVAKKIGMHTLEADYSQWTGIAKIKLDGEKLLSRFLIRPFGRDHIEMVSVGRKMFCVKFGGWMSYNATIKEVHNPSEEMETRDEINEPEFKPSALEEQREKVAMKEQKDKLGKINALLDKLDERLAQGEITEAKYKELAEKYRAEAERLKNQVTEQELMQEVGLKAREGKDAGYQEEEPEKPVFREGVKYCQNCGTQIYETADFCPECGVRVSEPPISRISTIPEKKSVAFAVVLSFFIPGVGQMYCGKAARGAGILVLSILMFSIFGYTAGSNPNSQDAAFPFLLWILVYIWNIYDAYALAGKINRGEA